MSRLLTAARALAAWAEHVAPEAPVLRSLWDAQIEAFLRAAWQAPPSAWDTTASATLLPVIAAEPEPATLALRLAALPEALPALGEAALALDAAPAVVLRRIARALGHLEAEHERAQALLDTLQGEEYEDALRGAARLASYRLTPAEAVLADSRRMLAHPVRVWTAPLVCKRAAHSPQAAFAWLADCTAEIIPLVGAANPRALLRYIACLRAVRPGAPIVGPGVVRPQAMLRAAVRHLAIDRSLLLDDPGMPHLNAALGMGLARLADEGEPLSEAEQRLQIVQRSFLRRAEEVR